MRAHSTRPQRVWWWSPLLIVIATKMATIRVVCTRSEAVTSLLVTCIIRAVTGSIARCASATPHRSRPYIPSRRTEAKACLTNIKTRPSILRTARKLWTARFRLKRDSLGSRLQYALVTCNRYRSSAIRAPLSQRPSVLLALLGSRWKVPGVPRGSSNGGRASKSCRKRPTSTITLSKWPTWFPN